MSTHNICFCREIRKILCGYPLLSVATILFRTSCEKTNIFLSLYRDNIFSYFAENNEPKHEQIYLKICTLQNTQNTASGQSDQSSLSWLIG